MKIWKSIALLVGLAATASAFAQARNLKQQVPDLRSLLRQGPGVQSEPAPRKLSAEERAQLRQQLSEPSLRKSKRS